MIAERQIARIGGRLVKSTGDGVLATFDGPAAAIRCARDIAGIAVHRARRICSASQPGETLVSRTVTDLVAGSGIEFEDRGDYELKGVPSAWSLFAALT